ncbi:LacI family DNA-binding transcriptional regulator [Pontibacter sp. G13]|uniref:LacI family DNA-binding transcriptional regulator n=1 Tax=Pontibacter sp. G13 TaxID=3074898 RepID=UPI00288A3482|nr:LacI family DNA-binding transcriptional regulator [Pontibacter sp. G13]WNJ20857.1 LacI family DNA-binding transcriptional regulator [Pontibacter sp. G13]
MEKGRITIKDIAKRLGISKSTVSRALRNHPNVKAETRAAVQALATELDYEPDMVALSLLNRQSFTLGVVIPRIEFPYFSLAISGAQEVASLAGYQLMICQTNESLETEQSVVRTLVASRVDGLMLSISGETDQFDHIAKLEKRGVPLVLFDRVFPGIQAPTVVMDNVKAGRIAAEHLLEQGYKRIAHIAGPDTLMVSHQRIEGIRQAHRKLGMEWPDELIFHQGFRVEDGRAVVPDMLNLPTPPDAIIAVSDSAAIGAKLALEERGISIPDQMGIIGFNNEQFTSYVKPELSSISLPMHEMGRMATKLLLHQISYPNDPPQEPHRVLPPALMARTSTARSR